MLPKTQLYHFTSLFLTPVACECRIKARKKGCHFTVFERLDGALPLLHLQHCSCTRQPPSLTTLPSFPIKLVWTQATEARNYQPFNLHRQWYILLQVREQRYFTFHLQCFEHLLHHATRDLPLNNTSILDISESSADPTNNDDLVGSPSKRYVRLIWEQQGWWFVIWCYYEDTVIFRMWPFVSLLVVPLFVQTIQRLTAALAFHLLHQFSTHLLTK